MVAFFFSLAPCSLSLFLLAGEFSLFARKFLSLALAFSLQSLGFLRSLALCLGNGSLSGFLHLDSYETVYLGVKSGIAFLLCGNDALYGFLLLLQRVNHVLLFHLLAFEITFFLFTFI